MRDGRWNYRSYRNIRTSQERRNVSLGCDWAEEYGKIRVRGRRSAANIPNSWDDISYNYEKGWKKKRKTQYRDKPRGKRHEIILMEPKYIYYFCHRDRYRKYTDYFEAHDIPFHKEPIKIRRWYRYHNFYRFRQEFFSRTETIGWQIVWWTDKNLGLEYLCDSVRYWDVSNWSV